MAEVKPFDVVLTTWRSVEPPAVTMTQAGNPRLPAVAAVSGAIQIEFPEIYAMATVTVRGTPGEDLGLWRFGFVQLGSINSNWAHYRNADRSDGSVFVARDRTPALDQRLCRDSVAKSGVPGAFERFPFLGPVIFYDPETPMKDWWNRRVTGFLPLGTTIPAGGKLSFTVLFSDSPAPHWWGLNRVNNRTMRVNYLYSLQYANEFATMFAFQKGPGKPIEVLKSFQWNVRWRAHFTMSAGQVVHSPGTPGDLMDMNISRVVSGMPNDTRFQSRVLDTSLPICNAQIAGAVKNQVIRESNTHEDWSVAH